MNSYVVLAGWAFAAGALIPVMGGLNAQLSRAVGGAPAAAAILFSVALAAAATLCVATRQPWPTGSQLALAPAPLYLGGLIVAFYVLSVTILVPVFGIGNTILFAMTAQIVMSAAMDHFGLFGAPIRAVSSVRIAGLALMLAGLFLAQIGVTRGH